mgnify:CR=1 FL=1
MDDLDTRLLVDLLRDRIRPNRSLGQHFLIDDAVISRSVDIAISRLRQKLKVEMAPEFIKTVWGAGYCFVGEAL